MADKLNLQTKSISTPTLVVLLLVSLAIPPFLSAIDFNYGILICCFVLLYVVAVSGLDVVFGYSGQISLGHAAYFAIGAYGSIMLHKYFGVMIVFSMLIASVAATLIGIVIAYPASRLRFHFLSLSTIAFGEIVYQMVLQSPGAVTGNSLGIFTESVNLFGFKLDTYTRFYYYGLAVVIISLILKNNLINSRTGRALIAIRENAHAADGAGINVTRHKVIAFAVSTFYCAYAGAMYAHLVGFVSPDTFMFRQSVLFLTMLLFGGTGSLLGPVIGAFSVTLLNEALRVAERYQMFIYGTLMLLVIIALPGGIYGSLNRLLNRLKRKEAR
ncbi:branched-chain amino acid ABC transporter permease [Synergistales bacterium]|nr:branched-chain amino acid ABC transporter permease [Synergistales bacterium]